MSTRRSDHGGFKTQTGTWCSGITSALHAEGPGFKPQCVHHVAVDYWRPMVTTVMNFSWALRGRGLQVSPNAVAQVVFFVGAVSQWAHGVVASHPLRMRKALGSIPSVSIGCMISLSAASCE